MPYITLGASTELQIKVPTNGTTDWGDTLKTDTFQKIAEHDHSGSGKGKQLGTGSIVANAITGSKIRLNNNEYLKARDAANSADVNIIKLNGSDFIEFGTTIITFTATTATIPTLLGTQTNAQGSATLTDNTAVAADASVITLGANETCKIEGKLVRGSDVRRVTLYLDQSNALVNEVGQGDVVGVTFSIASDQLQYVTTSTGNNVTFTYTIIKE